MSEFETKGSFKVRVERTGDDRVLSIVTKWGNEVIAHLTEDQAKAIAADLAGYVLPTVDSGCEVCGAPATFYGPDPYALELYGRIEEMRLCDNHLQSRREDI